MNKKKGNDVKTLKVVMLSCLVLVTGTAFADGCMTNKERNELEASCAKKATGFLGYQDFYAKQRCEKEREPQAEADACARKKEEAQKRIDATISELLAGRDSCFHRGVTPDDYRNCMEQRNWVGLDDDLSLFQSLCRGIYSTGCQQDVWEVARTRQREKEQQQEATEQAALKKKCGGDYHKPRVGMTLTRARQCVGELYLVSQMNRKDGVISTYRGSGGYIYVMGGKIVMWQARY